MQLVDFSAGIELLMTSPLSATVANELPERPQRSAPTIIKLELAKRLNRELGPYEKREA